MFSVYGMLAILNKHAFFIHMFTTVYVYLEA